MSDPLDKYYTPPETARALLNLAEDLGQVRCVVDPACGQGSLLGAATERWPGLLPRGLDLDEHAIRSLRREHPTWDVITGSIYPYVRGPRGWLERHNHDLVITNPPFSMARRRYVLLQAGGESIRCSNAMAHVLSAVQQLAPRVGVLAIMPESSLFSELDERARQFLARTLTLRLGDSVRNSTFRGARARCVLCAWYRDPSRGTDEAVSAFVEPSEALEGLHLTLVRGSLPVFRAQADPTGLPFIHSTDLIGVGRGCTLSLNGVVPVGSGQVAGPMVFVARVGAPRREHVVTANLPAPVQLSDCVLALCTGTEGEAVRLQRRILDQWECFCSLYRGTGARFLTVSRLRSWLSSQGVTQISRTQLQNGPSPLRFGASRLREVRV